ncbi:MAG TPA: hypothetical protein VF541_02795 [Longimicrobium sp.]|jgi:hypothetical protein
MPILLAAALGGCLFPPRNSDGVFYSEGVADATSFRCSRDEVRQLGYRLLTNNEAGEMLRAVRYLGRSESDRVQGYLTVSVSQDTAGRWLLVSAERFTENTDPMGPRFPTPVPAPVPQPPTDPGRTPPRVPQVSRREPRRLSPGEVASHARMVVRRCAVGGEARTSD